MVCDKCGYDADIVDRRIETEVKRVAEDIANKLIRRADHLLIRCSNPDSPMILVSSELKINAEEIKEAYNL